MKYKHLVAAAFLAVAACGSISAATSASSLRIYINPGHGSWTSDDRPCRTVGSSAWNSSNPDTTGFFESNTDLEKGFGLLEKLIEYGLTFDRTLNQTSDNSTTGAARSMTNNIVMSRVKNGPWPVSDTAHSASYNRSLLEICKEVESNSFDMFISIHSNAATDGTTTNYPLYEYRGTTGSPSVSGSDSMAKKCWPYGYANTHMVWTHYSATNMNIVGDITFYGSSSTNSLGYKGYLGVLKHGAPGFLVEGYFHTYQPARQRAMNWDVDRQEGVAYGRGIADYFGLTKESTGDIYGIVRASTEKYSSTYYTPNTSSNDVYLPMNGATVNLIQNGTLIKTYTTDDKYNGAFVFTGLTPGDYTIAYSKSGYGSNSTTVTVTAANTVYPAVWLDGTENAVTYTENSDYPDAAGTSGITASSSYDMTQDYIDSNLSELSGKTVRRTVLKGEKLYVLALDSSNNPTLLVYDTSSKAVLATVSTSGMTGSELNVSDIQVTSDGVLVACPKNAEAYSETTSGTGLIFYYWNNDDNGLPTGNPNPYLEILGGGPSTGNYSNSWSGETFSYSGTFDSGKIYFSDETSGGSTGLRVTQVNISNHAVSSTGYTKPQYGGSDVTVDNLGSDYRFYASPVNSSRFIIAGSGSIPVVEYGFSSASDLASSAEVSTSVIPAATPNVGFFTFGGKTYMAAPSISSSQNVGITLVDITDGLPSASVVSTTNTTLSATDLTNITANGASIAITDANDNVTNAYFDLILTRGATTISKFTTYDPDQKIITYGDRGEYAYGLGMSGTGGNYKATFNSTGAATANIILTDENGTEYTVASEAVYAGTNNISLDTSDLPEGTYSWKVEIVSNPISDVSKLYDSSVAVHGVTIDRNPSSAYYGYAYASHADSPKGIYMFDPTLNLVNSTPYLSDESWSSNTVESPYRLAMNPNNSKVVICDYGDTHAGLWAWDPANSSSVSQMFAGTLDTSTGAYTYNGEEIGGGVTGACFYGSGSSTELYAFCKDYPSNDANYLVVYDIGENETITSLPSRSQDNAHLANGDINVVVNDKGVWCSENRSAGSNTGTYAPAFTLFDFSGNALFYGSDLTDLDGCAYGGMALSDDFSKFAIVNASNQVLVYNVTWNGSTPSFTKSYDFTFCSSGNGYCYQMAFDPAGNLYLATNVGLQVYGLPNNNPVAVTESSETLTVIAAENVEYGERAEYAYDLSCEEESGSYVVTFTSTGDAQAEVILTNSDDGKTYTFDIGSVSEGENTATIDVSDIPGGSYSWKVEIVSNPISEVTNIFNSSMYCHGVVIDRDPSSPYFGYAYTTYSLGDSDERGIYMYDQDLNLVNSTPYLNDQEWSSSANSPYRLAINPNNSKVIVCDYGDSHSGLWVWDPSSPSTATQMFSGTRTSSTGEFVYNGSVIGGSITGAGFYGSGSDTKLFAECEDYPSANSNYMVGYDLGESETIAALPTVEHYYGNGLLANNDINVMVNDKGIWCAQHRTSGQNSSGTPAFILLDTSLNVLFNSSVLTDLDGSGYGGMAMSDDFSTFAIVDASRQVIVYNVTWNGSTPTFTKSYAFTFCSASEDGYCYQMAFDPAGNLYMATNAGLLVFGLPNDNPVADTESSDIMTVTAEEIEYGERAEYAYDLSCEHDTGTYTVTFTSTGDAEAKVILTGTGENTDGKTYTFDIGSVTEGENTAKIDLTGLEVGSYSWKVEIVSNPISDVTKVFDSSVAVHGVTIDRNSSSAYYGYAFASHADSPKGIYMFDPTLSLVNSTPYLSDEAWSSNTSKSIESPYRLAINPNSNKVVICDYGDTHAGLWAWDPANSSSVSQMFAGTLDTSTGAYTYNGEDIGGGVTGACFYGSGSSTELYAFCKDYPSDDANYLVVYDIGENETITSLPSRSQNNTHMANGDINVVVNDKGVWCSENRSAGSNTGTYAPAFTLFDFSGNALFYGSDLTDLDGCAYGGMALSDDFSKFAIVNASNQVLVYNVTWNGSTPSFTKSYDFTFCSSGNGYCYQMAFDPAGNLYLATNVGMQVYGLPNDNPVTDTESSDVMTVDETDVIQAASADKAATELKVYPNPATSTVNVEAGVEIDSINLYNLSGAMMKVDADVNGSSATINVDGLASGMYLLNVNGKSVKLIKK